MCVYGCGCAYVCVDVVVWVLVSGCVQACVGMCEPTLFLALCYCYKFGEMVIYQYFSSSVIIYICSGMLEGCLWNMCVCVCVCVCV